MNLWVIRYSLFSQSVNILLYKQTAEDFENENLIDHDDTSTIIDDFQLGNLDEVDILLNVDQIHIDNFGDDLESFDSNSDNNDLCVDDDVH